ncbi:hypothetical protein NliqN6_1866 [Naganishia liquefaciens]|uniref:N-acetyltransferase domain-containing protein n=1 Tax=Naganishia liquefaciens TaxID=104408 RepID=A0A8H3YDL8_9TREE|nr:hypothetical protein NliqN6_1866 [Naganishia liquefaciens]
MTHAPLHHRRARESDRETLLAMRKECGWGTDRLDKYLYDPTMATYIFYRTANEDEGRKEHEEIPIGMGCLTFDLPEDPDMASRARGNIALTSVFVFGRERGSGVGNRIFTILEGIAVHEHAAKTLTVDTRAFQVAWAREGEPSYLKKWYERLGYVEFRPAEPRYSQDGHPECRDSPDKDALLYACFLRKLVV